MTSEPEGLEFSVLDEEQPDPLDVELAELSERGEGDPCGCEWPCPDAAASPDMTALLEKYLDRLAKVADEKCGPHHFSPLHKDRETAILYCERCGLMRVIELAFTTEGLPPVVDVPTPLGMTPAWPLPGSGDDAKRERAELLAIAQRLSSLVLNAIEGKIPLPTGLAALAAEAEALVEDSK